MRNVVITGVGILSPIGLRSNTYWEALASGKAGFRPISLFDPSPIRTNIAGEITDFDALAFLGKKGLRDLDRSTRLISAAAKLAIEDSKLEITENNTHSIGVSIGTTFGSLHSISQFDRSGLIEGPRAVNPSHFPNTVINSPASQVSIRFKIKGFNTTVSTGFCAGLDAVTYAANTIKLNRAEVVLAGGVEELCEETLMGFATLGCLSGTDGTSPRACPYDARRNGIILSEGAAVLVLESEDHARRREAHIFAKLKGYANAFDPLTDFSFHRAGQGLMQAIAQALHDASLRTTDIEYISACANSSMGLDRMEARVIKEVFGEHATSIAVSSIKSMVGEAVSASGALSLSAAVGAIEKEFIPPTINYSERDPECDIDCVPNAARRKAVPYALVTAADPYGQNTALIIERYG
jgi:3-oxoacyl-[acyl-carrier-protein] synthase II